MLSEVTRIQVVENQREYLDKIFAWATKTDLKREEKSGGKSRPVTATTKTRPTTAYSRPPTAVSRPQTGVTRPQTGTTRPQVVSSQYQVGSSRVQTDRLQVKI